MPVPDYQECMLPVLELLADGQNHRLRDLANGVADRFKLDRAERSEKIPSGQQTVISNRVTWAKTYLKKAGLLQNPVFGMVRITDEGKKVLAENPPRIDNDVLRKYSSFAEFFKKTGPVQAERRILHPDRGETTQPRVAPAHPGRGIIHSSATLKGLDQIKPTRTSHPWPTCRGTIY
jgi:restriction endonuclease Mrr